MAEIIGTSGDDTLTGTAGDDLLKGQAGDDTLDGGNGDDTLFGGPEGQPTGETVIIDFDSIDFDDLLEPDPVLGPGQFEVGTTFTEDGARLEGFASGGNPAFFFTLSSDSDFFEEGSTALFLRSIAGTTTLSVDDGSAFTLESIDVDELLGVAGDITFTGTTSSGDPVEQKFTLGDGDGFETLEFGDNFTDLVSVSWVQALPLHQFDNIVLTIGTGVGDDGNDVLVGGNGSDVLFGGTGEDELFGGNGKDVLFGGDGNDNALVGGNGKDELFGGAGNDVLDGGKGSDILDGGDGSDILTGGSGSDIFVFGPGSGSDTDTITDFNLANDALSLDGLVISDTSEEDVDEDSVLDTVVTFDSGDTVTLLGVNGITEGDLVLV